MKLLIIMLIINFIILAAGVYDFDARRTERFECFDETDCTKGQKCDGYKCK